jgi:glutaredoxin 3
MAITLYTKQFCPYCVMAKRLLEAKGALFREIRVDLDAAELQTMITRSGRRTVPQIWIGDTHVGGFDDLAALDRQGKLNPMLAEDAASGSGH